LVVDPACGLRVGDLEDRRDFWDGDPVANGVREFWLGRLVASSVDLVFDLVESVGEVFVGDFVGHGHTCGGVVA
jgi:hypothetical protein